jgi:pimeloyl-ACP methyl ester carboxylesterase
MVPYFDNAPLVDELPGTLPWLLLGGYGENEWTTRYTIEKLGALQIHAVGAVMPFKQLSADRREIYAGCVNLPHAVGDQLRNQYEAPAALLEIIGHSQGGGIWGMVRRERPEGLGNAVLWAPVGYNLPETIADTAERERVKNFVSRFGTNALKQNPLDLAGDRAGLEVAAQLVFDIRTHRFVPKVGMAVMLALQREAIKHVNDGRRVGILLGRSDRVFRAKEIIEATMACRQPDDCLPDFIPVDGSHATMSSRVGLRQLQLAAAYLQLAGKPQWR